MTVADLSPEEQWAGILRPGEEILWQGQPDPGIYVDRSRRKSFRFSVLFAVVTAIIFIPAMSSGEPVVFLFALGFGGLSAILVATDTYFPAWRRRYTFYTLTNQRAILGTHMPEREPELKFFEIDPGKDYAFEPGPLGSIIFDHEHQGTKINDRKQYYTAGFLSFDQAEEVWSLVQQLQHKLRTGKQHET